MFPSLVTCEGFRIRIRKWLSGSEATEVKTTVFLWFQHQSPHGPREIVEAAGNGGQDDSSRFSEWENDADELKRRPSLTKPQQQQEQKRRRRCLSTLVEHRTDEGGWDQKEKRGGAPIEMRSSFLAAVARDLLPGRPTSDYGMTLKDARATEFLF